MEELYADLISKLYLTLRNCDSSPVGERLTQWSSSVQLYSHCNLYQLAG